MRILLYSVLIVFCLISCKGKENFDGYEIKQVYEYRTNEGWYSRLSDPDGWKLSTYVYNNKRILEGWDIMTNNPDTIKAKHIQWAKEYIEYYKQRRDTTIYIK